MNREVNEKVAPIDNQKHLLPMIGMVDEALNKSTEENKEENSQGGNDTMKHNVFENEQEIANNVLTLPLYADLTVEEVDQICDIILK